MGRFGQMKIAVITMVYNEKVMLPIWRRYYGAIFGSENLFILDHGSDDGSTEDIRHENRIKIFRETFSNADRVKLISKFHESLLSIYDYVIYTDCDEMLVPHPRTGKTLKEYIEARRRPYFTTVGLNLVHHNATEPVLDSSKPILSQRRHVQFVSPMIKTLISNAPIRWGAGFHSSTLYPILTRDLYLFHLKRFDMDHDFNRTKITRTIARPEAEKDHGAHQRLSDQELETLYASFCEMEVKPEEKFGFNIYIEEFKKSIWYNAGLYSGKTTRSSQLFKIPQSFADVF